MSWGDSFLQAYLQSAGIRKQQEEYQRLRDFQAGESEKGRQFTGEQNRLTREQAQSQFEANMGQRQFEFNTATGQWERQFKYNTEVAPYMGDAVDLETGRVTRGDVRNAPPGSTFGAGIQFGVLNKQAQARQKLAQLNRDFFSSYFNEGVTKEEQAKMLELYNQGLGEAGLLKWAPEAQAAAETRFQSNIAPTMIARQTQVPYVKPDVMEQSGYASSALATMPQIMPGTAAGGLLAPIFNFFSSSRAANRERVGFNQNRWTTREAGRLGARLGNYDLYNMFNPDAGGAFWDLESMNMQNYYQGK